MATATLAPTAPEWLWVSSPAATFGIAIDADGIVVDAAEVADDLIGLTESEAREVLYTEDPRTVIVAL